MDCRFCEGEGWRFNNAAQQWGTCIACKGRGFKGEPENDSQRLILANERIESLELRVEQLSRERDEIAKMVERVVPEQRCTTK